MINVKLLVLLFTAHLLIAPHAQAQSPKVIRIAAPEYWCPYACSAQDKLQGFAIEITRAAFNEVGIKVEYSNKPYDRILAEVASGKLDAVIPTFKSEAPNFIYPQQSISTTQYCFYTIDSHWRFSGMHSIKDTLFGVTSGYSYSPEMDRFIEAHRDKQVQVLHGNNIPQRMHQMVVSGRFQAFLEDTRLVDFLVKTKGLGDKLKRSGCINIISHGYLALSPADTKRSQNFSKLFDSGLNAIKLTGIPNKILKKYGVKDGVN